MVSDGVDGFLVECRNVDEMAKRALVVLSDPSRRKEMGKRAREAASARFCSTKIIPQYEEYYRQVLNGR